MGRLWLTALVTTRFPSHIPWGTLAVNALGSLLIGLIAAVPDDRLPEMARPFLMVGVLGGFTTFSAFSLQTASLFTSGYSAAALLYSMSSVAMCPFFAWLGWIVIHRG
jgi:CrcB protein